MKKDYLTLAIRALVGSEDFAYTGENFEFIQWITKPSKSITNKEVTDKITELQELDSSQAMQKIADKTALLAKLGITADEAALLLS